VSDPVRIGGFFATFDTEKVIGQLTAVRQVRIQKLDIDQARADARKAAIADLVTKFSSLLAKVDALALSTSVSGKSATSSSTSLSAAAGPSATPGSFTVAVAKLATGTSATGTAISDALDAASPLGSSNFATTPTTGTFTISTVGGGSQTFSVGPAVAETATLLNAANFAVAPTSGTYTIATAMGGSHTFTVDAATETLQDQVNAINAAGIGVTASITNDANGRANILALTSLQGAITVGDVADTSNFLTATNLVGSSGTDTRSSTTAFTKQMSLDEILSEINASGIGVTATLTNDANGRPNIVTLTALTAISLGTGADTSNFLSATNLLASPGTTTRASTRSIARLNPSEKMADASWFGGPPAAGAHSIVLNGVTINYNTANDSLSDIINRISASGAGVTARYDSQTDTIKLQQTTLGSLDITLADDGTGGDLLAKTGLLAATQTKGTNAEFSIDGGATQYSTSNTVTGAPGVTLTLLGLIDAGSPATVTVGQDSTAAVNAVKGFVTEFNNVMTAIDAATKADGSTTGNQSGLLSGDASIRFLKSTLRSLLVGTGQAVPGSLSNLSQVGLGFGAVGSAVGTTSTLLFDQAKFTTALANDPTSVQSLFSAFALQASLVPGGTGSISGLTGTYSGSKAGAYAIVDDGAGNLTATFTPADGGSVTTTSATIVANGSTTALIPGMTVQAAPALQGGTHTIAVSTTSNSVFHQLKSFLDNQAGPGGMLAKREDSYDSISRDIKTRKETIQDRIDREMELLRDKFIAMEQAQARSQAIMSSLQQAITKLSASNG